MSRAYIRTLSGTEHPPFGDAGRVLPGGFIYMADVLAMPDVVERMGTIIASQFYRAEPDFVLTMETKGIPE